MDRAAWTTALAIAAVAGAIVMAVAFPAIVVGVDNTALGRSVQEQTGYPPEAADPDEFPPRCNAHGGRFWTCGQYLVDVDWRGCWTAAQFIGDRHDPRILKGTESSSGCVELGDLLF